MGSSTAVSVPIATSHDQDQKRNRDEDSQLVNQIQKKFQDKASRRGIGRDPKTPRPNPHVFWVSKRFPHLREQHEWCFRRQFMVLGLCTSKDTYELSRDVDCMEFKVQLVDACISLLENQKFASPPLCPAPVGKKPTNSTQDTPKSERDVKLADRKTAFHPAFHVREGSGDRNHWDWEALKVNVVEDPVNAQKFYSLEYTKSDDVVRNLLTLDSVFLCVYLSAYSVEEKLVSPVTDRVQGFLDKFFHSPRMSSEQKESVDECGSSESSIFRDKKFSELVSRRRETFHHKILNDVAKLENQISFDLIRRVLTTIAPGDSLAMTNICWNWVFFFRKSLPGFNLTKEDFQRLGDHLEGCEHLLACLCRLTQSPAKTLRRKSRQKYRRKGSLFTHPFTHGHSSAQNDNEKIMIDIMQNGSEIIHLRSACYMRQCGVHFQGYESGSQNLVPKFTRRGIFQLSATLEIPSVSVVANTEMLWRNMMLFLYDDEDTEKSSEDEAHAHDFMSYLMFMDELINTEEDVAALRKGQYPVIKQNLLGTDKQVAALFNTVVSHQVAGDMSYASKWQDVRRELNTFVHEQSRVNFLEFLRYNLASCG